MNVSIPRLAITPGEPAGVGPELVLAMAQQDWPGELVVFADPDLLKANSDRLGWKLRIETWDGNAPAQPSQAGGLKVVPVSLASLPDPGLPRPDNAAYVLETLTQAAQACLAGQFQAMATGPVQKSTINEAGIPFSGHTEFLAELTGGGPPVMLLVSGSLRVALLTTHVPLSQVPARVTQQRLETTLRILHQDLERRFKLPAPRISVLGLNPHAGEAGHLGQEEQQVMEPVLEKMRGEGMRLAGPLPADTAFLPTVLNDADAILAMYHDQGLPVLKHAGFGRAVNVTLGLPIIRTSVDHGTALDLAGTGTADPGSLEAALNLAFNLAGNDS